MTLKLPELILAAAVSLALAGCDEPTPIEIGFIGGLSGRVADLGVAALDGVRLAVEEQNRKGGIGGHPIQLVAEDDKQDPETAKAAFASLASRHIDTIIGPMTSAMAVTLAPLADERHVTLLSPTVTTSNLAGQDDYFVRVITDTRQYAESSARFHFERRGIKSFVVLEDMQNRSYSESWAAEFRASFEGMGGKVTQILPFKSGQVGDFVGVARQAVDSHAEAVLILGGAADAAQICQQIRLIDARIPLVTSEWAASEHFLELGGDAVEGVFSSQVVDRESEQEPYVGFRRLFVERFQQEPGFAGIAGHDAATVMIAALKERRSGESLRSTVLRIGDFSGLQGMIHIDRFGDSRRPTYITVIRNGKFIRTN